MAQRRGETDAARAKRIAEWEKKRRDFREPLLEIPHAFNLRIAGEETVNGEETWIIEALPRPGYNPGKGFARFFPKVKGRFWISKRDYAWVKADAEVLDTISYGFILARLQKGSRLHFEQARVHGDVWVPKLIEANAALRLALFKRMHTGYEITYKDYRKFEVESASRWIPRINRATTVRECPMGCGPPKVMRVAGRACPAPTGTRRYSAFTPSDP